MMVNIVQLSKTVSHALRHEPWLYELELSEEGWVEVASLLAALRLERQDWGILVEKDLLAMMDGSEKKRFEMKEGRIRAFYGHSLPGKLKRERGSPPEILFHGTSPEVAERVLSEGLKPMGRQYVHLSADRETAVAVGKRKASQPVVLMVKALKAEGAGVAFYVGHEKVWLADAVPGEFLSLRE